MQLFAAFRRLASFALALATLAIPLTQAQAQPMDWPKGPVHVIVPFAAGSTPDVLARIVSDRLSVRLGKPMVIENKPGAAGNIGTDTVAKAAPDGQTIGVSIAGPLAVNALLFKKMPYDSARDLEPVTIAATQASVLVVSNKLAVNNTADLLALMKQNPGKYSFASMGAGTISHLAMAALSARSSADLVHVPYNGSGAALTALMSGDVDMAVLPAASVMAQIKSGKIKGLAVASARRSPSLPEFPTLAEAGVQDIQADAWIGFIVPAKTPPEIVARLHDELVQILAEPAVKEKLKLQYMDPVANTSDEFRSVLAGDVARWKPVIQKNNISLD
jgi:tripartite-type tricarboxylate transporter receptor subunit TctC